MKMTNRMRRQFRKFCYGDISLRHKEYVVDAAGTVRNKKGTPRAVYQKAKRLVAR
jgi:hypothetical protein